MIILHLIKNLKKDLDIWIIVERLKLKEFKEKFKEQKIELKKSSKDKDLILSTKTNLRKCLKYSQISIYLFRAQHDIKGAVCIYSMKRRFAKLLVQMIPLSGSMFQCTFSNKRKDVSNILNFAV